MHKLRSDVRSLKVSPRSFFERLCSYVCCGINNTFPKLS